MTLKQIADLLLHEFEGGDRSKDSQMDRRDIILKARSYASAVLKPVLFEKLNQGDHTAVTQAIYSTEQELKIDDAERKYVDIPDAYMNLTRNRGVHRVFVKGNPYADFVIQHNPGVSSNLPHMKIQGNQFCYIEGRRVIMGKGCKASRADKFIVQIINPAPDSIGENDTLPAAPEQISEIMNLIRRDYAPVSAIPNDFLNNQNANIR